MTRRTWALLAVVIAAGCAPEKATTGDPDAASGAPDAASNAPDASAPVIDAAVGAPDAPTPLPDAAVPVPDAAVPVPDAAPPADASEQPPVLEAVAPNEASIAGGEQVVVTGSLFNADAAVSFGGVAGTCTVASSSRIDCTVPAAAAAGRVDVIVTQTTGSDTLAMALTYFDANSAVDACNLVPPTTSDVIQGVSTTWQARVSEPGITDVSDGNDPAGALRGQIGRGPAGTDPATAPGWTWEDLTATAGYGAASPTFQSGFDQYELTQPAPARGQYAWAARFTVEDGVSYRFCGPGALTARSPIACTMDSQCFGDEQCLDGACRVDCATGVDCPPWGTQCTGLGTETDGETLALFCTPANEGGDGVGAACTSSGTCESDFCLVGLSDTCTIGCGTDDAVCAGAASPNVCAQFSGLGLCTPSCTAEDQCAAGHTCVINPNAPLNRFDLLCVTPAGADDIGGDCSGTIDCESGLCLTISDTVAQCTAFCVDSGDCAAPLPNCGSASITRPSGIGTQSLSVCVP